MYNKAVLLFSYKEYLFHYKRRIVFFTKGYFAHNVGVNIFLSKSTCLSMKDVLFLLKKEYFLCKKAVNRFFTEEYFFLYLVVSLFLRKRTLFEMKPYLSSY